MELSLQPERPAKSDQGGLTGPRPFDLACQTWDEIFVPNSVWNDVDEVWTWEGRLSDLATVMGVSQPYFAQSLAILQRCGSITTLRRGARAALTLLGLGTPPTRELYEHAPGHQKGTTRADQRDQLVRDLNARLEKQQQTINALVSVCEALDSRLTKLEEVNGKSE